MSLRSCMQNWMGSLSLNLLNRSMNLMQVLDAIFALPEEDLRFEVRDACAIYGHTRSQIELQLAEMFDPLYSYVPTRLLAQRNMLVMNKLGVNVMTLPTDRPGERTWKVAPSTEPMPSFAMQTIEGYLEMVSPLHNNIKRERFVDRPEIDRDGFMVLPLALVPMQPLRLLVQSFKKVPVLSLPWPLN